MCYQILFKHQHCALLSIEREELFNLFKGDAFDVHILYLGAQNYIVKKMIKQTAEGIDDIDIALEKAAFEAEAELNKAK